MTVPSAPDSRTARRLGVLAVAMTPLLALTAALTVAVASSAAGQSTATTQSGTSSQSGTAATQPAVPPHGHRFVDTW